MLLGLILPLLPIIFLLVVLGVALDIVLRDWMLPHMALEDASAGEAWSSVWARISAEKGQFFVYAILRLILPDCRDDRNLHDPADSGAGAGGSSGGSGVWHSLGICEIRRDPAAVAGVMLQVFFGLVAFGFCLLASICLGGPLSTATREYAMLFYGEPLPGAGRLAISAGFAAGIDACRRLPAV